MEKEGIAAALKELKGCQMGRLLMLWTPKGRARVEGEKISGGGVVRFEQLELPRRAMPPMWGGLLYRSVDMNSDDHVAGIL